VTFRRLGYNAGQFQRIPTRCGQSAEKQKGIWMSPSRVLADQIFPQDGIAADAVRIAAATILLGLCAHIVIPLPWTPVPITGQTFGVLLVGVLLGARRGGLALLLYLLEGAAGLPVFQPLGLAGAARFVGPTTGYLISYPLAALVTGWMVERGTEIAAARAEKSRSSTFALVGGLISGDAIIFAGGCAWLAVGWGLGWKLALQQGALPFVPGEIIKIVMIMAAVGGIQLFRRTR
jgi:biotin transport system substrate-specific component